MKEFALRAIDTASRLGARYADVRVVTNRNQSIATKDGKVEGLGDFESIGFGVRVLLGDAWGFASSAEITAAEIDRVTALAVETAKASAKVPGEPVDLGPPVRSIGSYTTPVRIDPFSVSLETKLALLLGADARIRRNSKVKVSEGSVLSVRRDKVFANSEGAYVEQTIFETGGSISATAVEGNEIQVRSYPHSFRQQVTGGWEYILEADFAGNAERIAAEAVALLTAAPCPSLNTTLILGSSQLALQIHESCGHPAELDRVFGTEAAFAGRSFLTTEKLNGFRYGSSLVNLTADSTSVNGLGTFGWDDEGIPASRTPLVRDGLFAGYLMSRETASTLGLQSNGCMRAEGWNRIPLIRMANVSLEPGTWEFDDMIGDTDDGVFMETNRSWSIDDMRYNFQFGTEVGYEIKKGKLGRLLKNCTYAGITPEFWNSCDAVGNARHWKLWGTPNCGKGEPMQTMGTGHGAAPGRFRNIRVGVFR
ncbi:MAG TPA: TldD/PmbA family protein [Terriglobia bacterium]|nr:TldD/PmbA family protein [Terriglobia bacterium]